MASATTSLAAAETHPEVVKSLAGQMDAWVESLGAALSRQPVPATLDAPPAPEGEVLEVTVTVTGKDRPRDRLVADRPADRLSLPE